MTETRIRAPRLKMIGVGCAQQRTENGPCVALIICPSIILRTITKYTVPTRKSLAGIKQLHEFQLAKGWPVSSWVGMCYFPVRRRQRPAVVHLA